MEKSLRHHQAFFDRYEVEFNNAIWEQVRKANEEKKPKTVFYQSLNYINSESKFSESLFESKKLTLKQGGRPVELNWDDDKIFFETVLLDWGDHMELPPLRKLSEFSFFDLKLVQLKIKDKKIILRYEEQWKAIDPYKFFDIMDDLCNFGDFLESYMGKKFNIPATYQGNRSAVDEKKLNVAWNLFQEITKEANGYLNYYEKKIWRDICVEVFWNYLQKIEYTFSPRGPLKLEIKGAVTDLNPGIPFDTMYAKVFINFKKFTEISKDTFKASFYKEMSFMATRRVAYPERTKVHFDGYLKHAFQYRNKQDHVLTVLYLNTAIYTYLNRYFCEKEMEIYLKNLLNRASVRDWKTASDKLFLGLEQYSMNQNLIYQDSLGFENTLHSVIGWFKRMAR